MENRLEIFLMVAGIWIAVSPWVLGFSGLNLAKWSNVFAGAIVAVGAMWMVAGKYNEK